MNRLCSFAVLVLVALVTINAASAPSTRHAIDMQHSKMTVYVYKQGLFSFLADNHEIDAPIANGSYDSSSNSIDITVDAAQMKVLDPKMAADKRNSVQSNMTGPQVLDVAKYPTIVFRSTKIGSADATHWKVSGNLTLHGQTHPIDVQVLKVDETHFSGSATIRQSAFGITPIKIAGGAVSVRDDVKIDFQVALGS
jgi:polyisoprenoid-binding protein YceI